MQVLLQKSDVERFQKERDSAIQDLNTAQDKVKQIKMENYRLENRIRSANRTIDALR